MNERQTDILRMLTRHSNQYLLIRQMTDHLGCSEKTVRNDLKVIQSYVEKISSAKLLRKPGLGVCLQFQEEDERTLFDYLHSNDRPKGYPDEQERLLQVAYHLLMDTSPITFQDLMKRYYVSKAVIKNDVEKIEAWIKRYDIRVISKQKVGLTLEGTEKNKRAALARLYEMVPQQALIHEFMKEQFSSSEVNMVDNVLNDLNRTHSLQLTDESFERIVLHTLLMIKRSKLGQMISMSTEELRYLSRNIEFEWASEFLQKLEPYLSLHFPDKERAYLSLHFLGGTYRSQKMMLSDNDDSRILANVLDMLVERVSSSTNIEFKGDKELMGGLNVHLQSTLNRLKHGLPVSNVMLNEIKKMYPYMFDRVMLALVEINEELARDIPEEEAAYVTLHFQSALERLKTEQLSQKKVVLVCHMGMGMSQLLRTKIQRKFHSVMILGSIAKSELKTFLRTHQVDLVISTVSLSDIPVPHIVVSPLLERSDESRLEQWLKQDPQQVKRLNEESVLLKYTNPFLVFLQQEETNKFEVIKKAASSLHSKGYVEKEYIESTMIRERMSATTIGAGIAIPHGHPSLIKQSAVGIVTLKEPVEWGIEKVSLVFLIAVKNENQQEMKQLFSEISFLSENPKKLQLLMKQKNTMNFLSELTGE
ncbi:BglG family transcription antiterminator [Bacillus sp. KH172YL63]|uniref:BglG family transcription antiterminator n=1 Tax=Bacillus sp. KH172YL63 TaxID=2709784 RepID=UPI0013E43814|nr:BglG family transcription antiterminator [Bacillus sp. KH172YL63]BCB05840.1 transcriptional regulator ManR [Bacillus sp. KH172YL63]